MSARCVALRLSECFAPCLNYGSPILACPAEGPSTGRDDVGSSYSAAYGAALEPVGPGRDYGPARDSGWAVISTDNGTGATWRARRVAPGLAAASYHGAGIGPDQPRSQPARLARSVTLPATALIRLSTRPPTSPGFRWNRVISGAEVRTVDRCLTDVAMIVTLRALFAVAHIIAQHRFGPLHKGRIPSCESIPASYTMAMLSTIYDT